MVPQNLVELWVVATRPLEQNGLGMRLSDVAAALDRVKSFFIVRDETAAIYPLWERLVIQHQVSGKPAHDARLVAAMQVHGIRDILTFDKARFMRYAGIEVVHPADLIPKPKR